MLEPSTLPEMTDADFRMLSELVRRHAGLHFGAESRFLLEKRVARRLRELELTRFSAYHYLLRSGGRAEGELPELIDELTTNETYFFRELGQLRGLIHEIIPEARLQRPDVPLSIWSAGCSSGEEPYSIVMLALEAGLVPGRDLRVYASDISKRMLRKAREGIYREASFRGTDPVLQQKYFAEKGGLARISDDVKKHVDFIHLNLMDEAKLALLGTMDVIVCRNVIIYFDTECKRRAIQTFHRKLRPGGHLLLGHSESLINLSTEFQLRHLKSDLVYQRPLPGAMPRHAWDAIVATTVDEEDAP